MQLFSSIQWQKDAWERWKKRALQIFGLISVSLGLPLAAVVAGGVSVVDGL